MTITTTAARSADKPRHGRTESQVPTPLLDVALIDGPAAAAAACISKSQWLELVRLGQAPAPCIKQPRMTRWRMADVRGWLEARAKAGRLTQEATR